MYALPLIRRTFSNQLQLIAPTPGRNDHDRQKLDDLIKNLVGDGSRPGSTGPAGAGSPAGKGSRPNSVLSAGELSNENSEAATQANRQSQPLSITTQILSTAPLATVYEFQPSPVKEVFSY